MKKLSSIAVAMLAICLLAGPLASAQDQKTGETKAGSAEQQIKALQAEFVKAILKGDTSFYPKYYADDANNRGASIDMYPLVTDGIRIVLNSQGIQVKEQRKDQKPNEQRTAPFQSPLAIDNEGIAVLS